MDSVAVPDAGSAPFGTVDSDLSLATDGGPIQWIHVSGGGTDVQEDVVYLGPPLPGAAPMTSYWVNALCVR